MDPDINVLALVKGADRYVLIYDDASTEEALRQLGRWASELTLSFTWVDAAAMSQRIRQTLATAQLAQREGLLRMYEQR